MKKFLITLLSFFLCVAVCVGAINQLYRKKYKETTIENVPKDIQVCNFGNSQPYNGIDYSFVKDDVTCYNFALPAQSFSYDYRILQNYKENIDVGAKVFLCVSYHALFGTDETEANEFASKNRRYYLFLPKHLIKEYDFETEILVKYLPSLTAGISLIPTILGVYDDEEIIERTSKEEAIETAQSRYKNLFGDARDIDGKIRYDKEDIDCLKKMIDLCREIGAEPILFTTPYLKEYVDVIRHNDPELLIEFYRVVNEIKEEKQVEYYDWSQDEKFAEQYSLFADLDHLNSDGAHVFTEMLMSKVRF